MTTTAAEQAAERIACDSGQDVGRGCEGTGFLSGSRVGRVDDGRRGRDNATRIRHSAGMESIAVTIIMLAMALACAAVVVHILRNRPDSPDLPSERSAEQARAHAGERSNHSGMGPF
jgi:hypothetical protein